MNLEGIRNLKIAEKLGYSTYIGVLEKLLALGLVTLDMPREIIDLKVLETAFLLKCKEKL